MSKRRYGSFIPFLVVFAFALGIYFNKWVERKKNAPENTQSTKVGNLLNYISQKYVDPLDQEELEEKLIPHIFEYLDPHSTYIPAKDLQKVNEPLIGNFTGIGVQFKIEKDTVTIIKTIANGPSEKVGIRAGDRIVHVENMLIAGVEIESDSVVKLLRGPKNTEVNVRIKRRSERQLLNFKILRDEIPLHSVDVAYMVSDDIGYIKINKFSATTFEEMMNALIQLKERGMKKLIADVRGNGGGYLTAAINICDQFLKEGQLIVYTEGYREERQESFATKNGLMLDGDVVVLIDEYSASASEILAGAIQDNDRGTIIGRRSFGKGLVQDQKPLSDGSAIRLTIARYFTPTGRSIQKPYDEGLDQYALDLAKRLKNGEYFEQDSIEFADSLKFITPKGKVVYGGGGIMPDVFIPIDTTFNSSFYNEVIHKGLIYKFAFEYADQNRNELLKIKNVQPLISHLRKRKAMSLFVEYAKKNEVEENIESVKKSYQVIETRLFAEIARNIYGEMGFYPIIKRIDKPLQKAIDYLQ